MPERTDEQTPEQRATDSWRRERERERPARREEEPQIEQEAEQLEEKILESIQPRPETPPPLRPSPPPHVTAQPKDALTREIEAILSEGLGALYMQLPSEQKVLFKSEGERAASVIRVLIEQVKVKAKTVLDIIRRWLKIIPGVNKFFLEQEAKIKVDKVLALHSKIHRGRI